MRLTLVISSLGCGGAERVLTTIASGLLSRGYEVTVITQFGKEYDFYQLPQGVNRIALEVNKQSQNIFDGLRNNIRRLAILRRAISRTNPDVVISFIASGNILTLISLIGKRYPVVVTEHCDQKFNYLGKPWKILRRLVYPWATKVISVSEGVESYFAWLSENKKQVIYNPFIIPETTVISDPLPLEVNYEAKWITSMGRLTHKKGFDILLKAFSKIANNYPSWQVLILGNGKLRTKLEKLRDDLDLTEKVIFTGAVKNPFAILKKSQFFVMSSRIEGFPMAHGEALTCGLPVISTDCPSGPKEIIRDGIDGILVPNEDINALANAMEKLMSDCQERNRLANNSLDIINRFGLSKIIDDWEILFNKL